MGLRLLSGDTREIIRSIDDQSIQLIITSPPYGNIVNYKHDSQIGYGQEPKEYHKDLREIFDECIRVLHPNGRLIIIVGDEFVASNKHDPFHIIPHRARLTQDILKNSNMRYTGTIIWKKVNGSARNAGGRILGSINMPRNGYFFVNREYILIFKKLGLDLEITSEQKKASKFSKQERATWFRDTWSIKGETQNIHPAMFPMEIPERLIRMYSFVGETILDPFCGTGTTLAAAYKWGRKGIGIELGWCKDWMKIAKNKIKKHTGHDLIV